MGVSRSELERTLNDLIRRGRIGNLQVSNEGTQIKYLGEQPAPSPQPTLESRLVCTPNQFECKYTRKCIEKSQLCDYNQDCDDRTDESECVMDERANANNKDATNI
ncbi:hypothetical protein B4U79_17883 [Dinothrombium tinctorium]|uniref:Uncharacterized protein n=1 Tax=Dinothrombium tinctorium TaxID=1965070 RepID=A0A3S3PBE5_9ACAR|nr:hypothetical protein B4U79_17965 [Dinothrombium tinctorium]RWS16138.1 hypothetical protein B4U79_17883 [Dinothrombium tinctorium]